MKWHIIYVFLYFSKEYGIKKIKALTFCVVQSECHRSSVIKYHIIYIDINIHIISSIMSYILKSNLLTNFQKLIVKFYLNMAKPFFCQSPVK